MSFHHTFQYYTFDTDPPSESPSNQNEPELMLRQLQLQLQSHQLASSLPALTPMNLNPLPIIPWTPSTKFTKLLDNFKSSILNQFPCAPCAFCGRLMYPEKCEWLPYIDNYLYPLLEAYPERQSDDLLIFHTKLPKRVSVCSSCKNTNNRYAFPFLHPIPNEIQAVPIKKRMYLSPVFIHCSLGRSSGLSSIYTEYRTLTGTMNFSKNMRSLILYSGMLGAYLEDNSSDNSWLDNTAIEAANWLKQNNPYLKNYSRLLDLLSSSTASPFPSAFHLPDDNTAPPYLDNDIVVPNVNFNVEIQDRKSTRLNSSHSQISYAVFCLKKKKTKNYTTLVISQYE